MIRHRTTPRMLKATSCLAVLCFVALLLPLLSAQAQKAGTPPPAREGGDKREPTDPASEVEKLKEETGNSKLSWLSSDVRQTGSRTI